MIVGFTSGLLGGSITGREGSTETACFAMCASGQLVSLSSLLYKVRVHVCVLAAQLELLIPNQSFAWESCFFQLVCLCLILCVSQVVPARVCVCGESAAAPFFILLHYLARHSGRWLAVKGLVNVCVRAPNLCECACPHLCLCMERLHFHNYDNLSLSLLASTCYRMLEQAKPTMPNYKTLSH